MCDGDTLFEPKHQNAASVMTSINLLFGIHQRMQGTKFIGLVMCICHLTWAHLGDPIGKRIRPQQDLFLSQAILVHESCAKSSEFLVFCRNENVPSSLRSTRCSLFQSIIKIITLLQRLSGSIFASWVLVRILILGFGSFHVGFCFKYSLAMV